MEYIAFHVFGFGAPGLRLRAVPLNPKPHACAFGFKALTFWKCFKACPEDPIALN